MENSNFTYLMVVQQTVKPSSGLAAACFRLKAHHYYSTLGLIALFVSPTFCHHPLRIAASPFGLQQVQYLHLPCVIMKN